MRITRDNVDKLECGYYYGYYQIGQLKKTIVVIVVIIITINQYG